MTLNHLYLLVRDLDRSVAFYRDHFGFDGLSDWQGETFVIRNVAGFALALRPDPEPPPWPQGLHYGFLLDSVPEAARLRARIIEAGFPITESYAEPAFVMFKCQDPDGYVVEVEAGVPETPRPEPATTRNPMGCRARSWLHCPGIRRTASRVSVSR